jgi:sugar phosphate permease
VLILFFAWLIDYIDRLVITLALPEIGKQFSINEAEQGLILSVFFITYSLFQVPGGRLADWIGSRKTMTIALSIWSAFTALTAVAVTYALLLVIRLVFGASEGMFPGASMKAIAERTTPKQRLTANGVMLCSNPLGSALAPLVAAPAIAAVGWRYSFLIVCGFGVIIALIVWFLMPKALPAEATSGETVTTVPEAGSGTRQGSGSSGSANDSPTATMAAAKQAQDDTGEGGARPGRLWLLRAPDMWKLFFVFFGFDTVSWGLVSWAPSYLITNKHVAVASTGILVSIPWFVATGTTVIGGILFDRYFHDRQRWLIIPCMVLTAIFLYFMLSARSSGGFTLFETIGVGIMFLTFMPIIGLPVRLLPRDLMGTATGLVNFGGQAAGAIVAVVMGALAEAFGFPAAFSYLIFGVAVAIVAALLCPQNGDKFRSSVMSKAPAGVAGRSQAA